MPAVHLWCRCLAQAACAKGIKALAGLVPFGDALYEVAAEALQRIRKAQADAAQLARDVAATPPAEAKAAAEQVAAEVAADQPAAVRHNLTLWLTALPAALRRSLRRPSDPSGTTPPAGYRLDGPEALLPLLPGRLPRFRPGDRPTPGGEWELVEMLGAGGFGEVWLARHPQLSGLTAALKFCLDPEAAAFLRHEAELLSRVMRQAPHPGIVGLRQAHLSAEPYCLVYEYIAGGDLAGLARDWPLPPGGPAPADRSRVVQHLATILGHAHRLDPPIVHRDLKPANVLVQRRADGKLVLRVADFGIGGLAARRALERTRLGPPRGALLATALFGSHTPLYASPQQARGMPPDPRDDVHAIGVIWYQLLTGDLGAGRPSGQGWKRRLAEQGTPAPLLALLEACVDDDPTERPADAHDLTVRLSEALARTTPPADPVRPPADRPCIVVDANGGGDYRTVADAVRAAPPGALVVVRPGVYRGSLRPDRTVQIVGEPAAGSVVLESDAGPVVAPLAEGVILRHVTIRGRAGSGGTAYAVDVARGHLVLEDCQVTSDSLACVAVHGPQARVTLRRCKLHDGKAGGLFFWERAGGLVEDCEVSGHQLPGIEVKDGADPVVRRCKIHHCGSAGILLNGGGRGTYEDCDVHSHDYQGVAAQQGSEPVVRNCRIYDNKMGGIFVWEGGRGTYEGCDVKGNGLSGVEVKEQSDPIMRQCIVRDGKAGGVLVCERGLGTYEDCDIYGNRYAGFEARERSEPIVRRCTIRDGREGGVWVHDRSAGTFEQCEISGNARVGVEVRDSGTNPTFRHCKIHNGQAGGVLMWKASAGVLHGCEVWGNQMAGLSIGEAADPVVRHCKIHNGQAGGVFIYDQARGTLEHCEVRGNVMAGVEVKQGSDPVVRHCQVHGGRAGGLFIHQDARGLFEHCEIHDNALTGLEVKQGADPVVRACRFYRNAYQAVYVHDRGQGTIEECDMTGNTAGAWYLGAGCRPRRRGNLDTKR